MFRFLKNSISFLIFNILSLLKRKRIKVSYSNNVLLINTGKIGDLIVSSIFLENDDLFQEKKIFFLLEKKYKDLFFGYNGNIRLIYYNSKNYKWNIFYRLKILKILRSYGFSFAFNISPARGFIGDEISLLSGAEKIYATCDNMKYLGKYYGRILDRKYTDIKYREIKNEYIKLDKLVKEITGLSDSQIKFFNSKSLLIDLNLDLSYNVKKDEYILISPLVTDMKRSWGVENYKILTQKLSESFKVLLIGSIAEKNVLKYISGNLKNVFIITPSLRYTPSVINFCKLFIGNHSGLSHIALKLQKPLIAIVDGGFFNYYFPIFEDRPENIFIYHKLECFECDWNCKYHEPLCLKNITVENVLKNVNILLNINNS